MLVIGKLTLDFILFYPFPKNSEYQFGTRGLYAEADKSLPVSLIGFGAFLFYLFLTLKCFPAYRQYVRENFSDPDDLDFTWLRNMLIAVTLGVLVLLCFKLLEVLRGGISYKTDWYAYAALAILSYYIGINGYYIHSRQLYQLLFHPEITTPLNEREARRDDIHQEAWLAAIKLLMQTSKPFLQPELSLADLAAMLGTSKSVISKVINSHHQQNFNDFVNQYRIEQVIDDLKHKKHHQLTFLGIAYDCGFNSKATFNRAFKKVTGQTPRDFVRKTTL